MPRLHSLYRRFIRIPKQLRYVIASIVGGVALFAAAGAPYPFNLLILPVLCLLSYGLVYFGLLEDIKRHEWFVLFIVPVIWTACWYVSFYMLPSRFVSRMVFSIVHIFIMYILIGAMNIFNVGVEKNIQLQRAAQAANQFVIVLVFYLYTQIISSLNLYWIVLGTLTGIFAGLMGIQAFWTYAPRETISRETFKLSLFQGFVMGHMMILLTFVPFLLETPRPMIVTGVFYILSGILANYTDEVAFRARVREYLAVLVLLVIAAVITIQW